MKNIYSFGAKKTKRNFTVYDLLNSKGKLKLTQVNSNTAYEAEAANKVGIDLLICSFKNIDTVRSKAPNTFLTAAVPFTDFCTKDDILKIAMKSLEKGADAIYTARSPHVVEHLSKECVPVMAHLGLVPRKSTWIGGIRATGKTSSEAFKLYQDFKDMENAGAVLVEAEVIAGDVLSEISKRTSMVTVSLGSGNGGDVNYLFMEDICGENKNKPRHAISYGNINILKEEIYKERIKALKKFDTEARTDTFAKRNNIVKIDKTELKKFLEMLK